MAIPVQLNDPGYKNWLKACLGLQYLKEGILDFVDTEVKQFHTSIIGNICNSVTCNHCSTNALTARGRHKPCPYNVCDKIRQEIENRHRYNGPCWKNTDATKWCTDYWEIGKCFMSPGYTTVSKVAETDCTGLLSICINGLFLPPTLTGQILQPTDIFHKNRDARNTLLHSGSMSISDAERQDCIDDMIKLLTNYKTPVDHVTQAAIDKLNELNSINMVILPDVELSILHEKQDAMSLQMTLNQTEVERQINEQKTDSDQYRTKIKNKLDAVNLSQAEVVGQVKEQKTDLDQHKQEMKNKIDAVNLSQAEVVGQVKEQQTDLDQHKQQLDAVTLNHAEVVEQIKEQQTDLDQYKTQIQSKIDALTLEVKGQVQKQKTDTEQHQQQLDVLNLCQVEVEGQVQKQKTVSEQHQQQIDALNLGHAEVTGQVQKQKTDSDQHQQQIDALNLSHAEVKGQVQKQKTDSEQHQQQIDALNLKVKGQVQKQKTDSERHEEQIQNNAESLEGLCQKIENQEIAIHEIKKDLHTKTTDKEKQKIIKGIFAVPKGCCALQYGRAVKEYSQRYGRHDSLQEIHFVDIDDEMLQFISVAFDFVINGNTSAERKLAELEKNKTKKWYQRVINTPKTKLAQPLGTDALHFTVSGRDIVLKTGDLVEFGEGVIVCSQKHPCHIVGRVAKAIQIRHPNFLKELKQKREKEPTRPGDIVVASSGEKLRCAHIYNVVVPHHGKNEEQFSTLLVRCYFNVFKKAEDGGIRNIALPLLATGRGAKADLSARCLMNALMLLNQPRKLKEIHVINNRMEVTETVRRVLSETRDDGQVPGCNPDDRRHGRSPVHKFEDVPTTPPIYSDKGEANFSTIREIKNLNRSSTNSGDNNRESDDNAYAEIGSGERNTPDRTKFGSSEKLCPICLDPIEGGGNSQ